MAKHLNTRHLRISKIYLQHLTPRKMANMLRVEKRLLLNDGNLDGLYPHIVVVEASNNCNLRCPLCQMGQRRTIPRKQLMSAEAYKSLILPLAPYVSVAYLQNWGEPFFNKEIYAIIRTNTVLNIGTVVSSNFNIDLDPYRLIDSGLAYLIISGDGITQDVYSKYRRGGDITRVLKNLDALVEAKKLRNSRTPFIEWQCLVTKYNENQLVEIEETARARGANAVKFANINFVCANGDLAIREEYLPSNEAFRGDHDFLGPLRKKNGLRKPCYWLWRAAVINVNGGIVPCCLYDVPDWGNVFENDFLSEWNNHFFQEARSRSNASNCDKKMDLICDHCTAPFIYK